LNFGGEFDISFIGGGGRCDDFWAGFFAADPGLL